MNYELSLLNYTSPFLNTPNIVSKLKCLESPSTHSFHFDKFIIIQDSRTFLPSVRNSFTLVILPMLLPTRFFFCFEIFSTRESFPPFRFANIRRTIIFDAKNWRYISGRIGSGERDKIRLKSHRAYPTRSRHSSRE